MQNQPPPSTPRRKTTYKWWIQSDPPYHLSTLRTHRLSCKTWAEIAQLTGGRLKASHLARYYRRHFGKVTKDDLENLRLHRFIRPTNPPEYWDDMSIFAWRLLQTGSSPTKVAEHLRSNGWSGGVPNQDRRLKKNRGSLERIFIRTINPGAGAFSVYKVK